MHFLNHKKTADEKNETAYTGRDFIRDVTRGALARTVKNPQGLFHPQVQVCILKGTYVIWKRNDRGLNVSQDK